MPQNPMIASDPTVMMGKPVVAGTRITVQLILERLAAGESIEDLLAAYPKLTREGIQAAIAFASEVLTDVYHPIVPASH